MSDATVYGFIYEITNKVNNKVYIGQTCQTITRRWQRHRYDALCGKSSMAIHHAMKKYGLENFTIEVMTTASSKEELNRLEQTYISGFNTLSPHGYNLKSGGDSGGKCSEEMKQKMSEAAIKQFSDPETRKKMSEARLGVRLSPDTEFKKGLAPWNKGKPGYSTKAKRRGIPNPKRCVPVVDSNGIIYESVNAAALALSVNKSAISLVLKGKNKTAKGLTFSYYTTPITTETLPDTQVCI